MKTVFIYLRSVEQKERFRLALFDSNRNGAIDDLITEVQGGDTIIWKLDCHSGIKTINRIASKNGKGNVFRTEPVKWRFRNVVIYRVPKDAEGEEAYLIEYTLCSGKKLTVDPYIRIKLPGDEG